LIQKQVSPAVFLEWDTAFFGKRIGRVLTHNLKETEADEVDAWAFEHKMDCIYYLADGSDHSSYRAAENHQYHHVDLRVTFHMDLTRWVHDEINFQQIRQAKEEDIPQLQQMTRYNHQISRFFADDHFDREKCMNLYEVWIERDLRTKEHGLWVWEENDRPIGYTSVQYMKTEYAAEIGLVGVHPDFRGRGIGLALQLWVLQFFNKSGVKSVEVVTQGRNISAQNLYQKCGYRLKSIDLWYHKWYTNP